jgi:mono/diheme cytochrome c family protein
LLKKRVSQSATSSAFGLAAAAVLAVSMGTASAAGAPPPEVKPTPPPQVLIDPNDPNDPNLPANLKAAQDAAAAMPAADPAQVAKGEALFKDFCQKCHGIDMVSPGPPFFDLRTFPHGEKPRFVNSVTNGKGLMPAWGGSIKPAEIESLWAYVSSYKQTR